MPSDYGIKISEEGYDVFTADDEHLILSTKTTLLKVKQQGSVNFSGGSAIIEHGLGYVPQFFAFGLADNDDYIISELNNTYWYPDEFTIGDYLRAEVDNNYLYLYAGSAHGTSIVSAYYYIFYEAA